LINPINWHMLKAPSTIVTYTTIGEYENISLSD
jgi:hypothetical protein